MIVINANWSKNWSTPPATASQPFTRETTEFFEIAEKIFPRNTVASGGDQAGRQKVAKKSFPLKTAGRPAIPGEIFSVVSKFHFTKTDRNSIKIPK